MERSDTCTARHTCPGLFETVPGSAGENLYLQGERRPFAEFILREVEGLRES